MAREAIRGKVALVTGAGRRIGRSIALRLAADGADVIVNYSQSRVEAEGVVRAIQAQGRRAMAVQADVSKRGEVQRMFAAVEKEFGGLDVLVNNAGAILRAKLEDLTEEQWDRIMGTNLKALYLCSQAALPLIRKRGGGNIINITSVGGLLPWPDYPQYCASKAGAIMLTKCLARALAPEIRVNSVAPGTIQFADEAPDENYIRRAPLHKTGTGEDIADAVSFLIGAEFITGQNIVVDGGRVLT